MQDGRDRNDGRRSGPWLLIGAALILLGLAACNGQPDGTPAGLGAGSDPTPTPTVMESPTPLPTVVEIPTPLPTVIPPGVPRAMVADPFARWNGLEPRDWWRELAQYSCLNPAKETSPWIEAGMTDLGGSDPLSLIRFYGNVSYLRYGFMGFEGCTPVKKYPYRTYLDPPVDPACYSLGDLAITVDIARVPPDAPGWFEGGALLRPPDDGEPPPGGTRHRCHVGTETDGRPDAWSLSSTESSPPHTARHINDSNGFVAKKTLLTEILGASPMSASIKIGVTATVVLSSG